MMKQYDFKDLCKDFIRILPANLHSTKEGKCFLWIATKDYDIGALPIHYEIRKYRTKIYSEIHYEGKGNITSSANKITIDLSIEFQNYFNGKNGYMKVPNNVASNLWYRKKDSGVIFSEDCVEDVLKQLKEIVKDTRTDLLKMLSSYF